MLARFWRTMGWLAGLTVVISGISSLYLSQDQLLPGRPSRIALLTTLPTDFPSIWSFTHPLATNQWLAPFLAFLIQVVLTGGFYGTLVRLNSRQTVGIATFVFDAVHSFWRLFLWNMLWYAATFFALGVSGAFHNFASTFAVLLVIARFVFLFAEVALVCEQQVLWTAALQKAAQVLFGALPAMLPIAIAILVTAGIASDLVARLGFAGLWLMTLVYGPIMTWWLHLIVARYLHFSDWRNKAQAMPTP